MTYPRVYGCQFTGSMPIAMLLVLLPEKQTSMGHNLLPFPLFPPIH